MLNITKEQFLDVKKQAELAVEKAGLTTTTSKVGLVIDISGSMSYLFSSGVVQAIVERVLALGIKFDDNQAIDIFLFDNRAIDAGELTEDNFHGYVKNNLLRKYSLGGGTNYAPVMNMVMDKYVPGFNVAGYTAPTPAPEPKKEGFLSKLFGGNKKEASTPVPVPVVKTAEPQGTVLDEPVYIMFLTDGDNSDPRQAEEVIKEASNYGVFWKFLGVGNASFSFLKKLDDMDGRFIDNADFQEVNDIAGIDDNELFDRLLVEFPQWVENARNKNLIK